MFLPALSLNWIIRYIQPIRATQLKIQASWAWPGTWRLGEEDRPLGVDAAGDVGGGELAGRLARACAGSCQTVIACRSTMQ